MTAHGEAFRTESNDDPLVEGIKRDYTQLDLLPAERAMLDYAVKLTVAPASGKAPRALTRLVYPARKSCPLMPKASAIRSLIL
jgi:alkylhydroperoxidase family enzyme